MSNRQRKHNRKLRAALVIALAAPLLIGGTVLATAPAAASSAPVTVDDSVVGTGDAQFNYTGSWSSNSQTGFYNNTHHFSNTTGSSVTIAFTGTQIELFGGTGAGAGIANVSIDGGAVYQVDFYSAAEAGDVALWVSPLLNAGSHALTVTVSGLKNNFATDTYVAPDRVTIYNDATSVDDRITGTGANQFNYSGTWGTNGSAGYYANTHSWDATTNDFVTFQFTGQAITLYGGVGTGAGIGAISIDGGPETNVDFYGTSEAGNKPLWTSDPLASGTHTLKVRVTGTHRPAATGNYVVIDRVDVIGTLQSLPLPTTTGDTTTGWSKFARNPVVGKSYGTAFDISVLREHGIYRMWFSWRPQHSIGYVQSVDGINWTAPVTVLPAANTGWETDVNRPSVIHASDGTYKMWYTGQTSTNSWIGYATSPDGVTWTRYSSSPVLSPTAAWEQTSVMIPNVIQESPTSYKMWYSGGQQYEPNAIGYATSTDGVNWTKYASNPVLSPNPANPWEQDRVAGAQVFKNTDGYYYAFYIGYKDINTAAIGLARSIDGITGWNRLPTNPIVNTTAGAWDCSAVYKPYAVWEPDTGNWKLWYNGRCGTPEQIGVVIHPGFGLGF